MAERQETQCHSPLNCVQFWEEKKIEFAESFLNLSELEAVMLPENLQDTSLLYQPQYLQMQSTQQTQVGGTFGKGGLPD